MNTRQNTDPETDKARPDTQTEAKDDKKNPVAKEGMKAQHTEHKTEKPIATQETRKTDNPTTNRLDPTTIKTDHEMNPTKNSKCTQPLET